MSDESIRKETIDTFSKVAEKYQDKFMDIDLYNDAYDKFCNLIQKEDADIFEIATGPGNVTRYLKSKRPDFRILGIDLAPNMVDLAKKNNPDVDFRLMDCRDISSINKKFDGVMCGFCLPFLSKEEVRALFRDVSAMLNSPGYFYLSTMEDDYSKSGFEKTTFSGNDRIFFYYHQSDYLTECLQEAGLEITYLQRQDYPEPDGTVLTDLIIIASK
jgi:ubiquinone/menaquinone biosynthesis C-methylase UbiE